MEKNKKRQTVINGTLMAIIENRLMSDNQNDEEIDESLELLRDELASVISYIDRDINKRAELEKQFQKEVKEIYGEKLLKKLNKHKDWIYEYTRVVKEKEQLKKFDEAAEQEMLKYDDWIYEQPKNLMERFHVAREKSALAVIDMLDEIDWHDHVSPEGEEVANQIANRLDAAYGEDYSNPYERPYKGKNIETFKVPTQVVDDYYNGKISKEKYEALMEQYKQKYQNENAKPKGR